jgi:hypothetical protein
MKIVCPSCDATYEVPDIVVTSRRKMRCARCTTDWVPADQLAADTPEPVQEEAAEPSPVAPRRVEPAPVEAPSFGPRDAAGPLAGEAIAEEGRPVPPAGSGEPMAEFPQPDAADIRGALPGRREDEPYQLALRPETHVSVFPAAPKPLPLAAFPKPAPPASKAPVVVAWAASILILAAAVAGFLTYRGQVMKAWPPSARLYAALGLTRP